MYVAMYGAMRVAMPMIQFATYLAFSVAMHVAMPMLLAMHSARTMIYAMNVAWRHEPNAHDIAANNVSQTSPMQIARQR